LVFNQCQWFAKDDNDDGDERLGLRRRIDEYYQDNYLEKICLHKYNTIKNMGVIVMLVASFCARLFENLVIKLLVLTTQLPHNRLRDIPLYPYYMIIAAVARAREHAGKRRYKPFRIRKRVYFQLNFDIRGI